MVRSENQVANPVRTNIELSEKVLNLNKQLAQNPENADLWIKRGLALVEQNLMREAVESYSKALCLEPFNWLAYRNRAHRHLSCWEFQEACSDFIMSTRLVPNTVDIHEIWEAWYLLALSHYLLGEYEKAADAYQTCYGLARGDDIITTTGWYWSTLMRLGRKEEAEKILAPITKETQFEASREAYFSTLRMFKGWGSPEDTEAQCNMPDCKDKFTRLYAISNYYYITGDLENSNRVIDRILEEAGPEWWMVFGYLAAMVDKKARSNA